MFVSILENVYRNTQTLTHITQYANTQDTCNPIYGASITQFVRHETSNPNTASSVRALDIGRHGLPVHSAAKWVPGMVSWLFTLFASIIIRG